MADTDVAASPRAPGMASVTIAFVLVCLNLRIVFGGPGPLLPFMKLDPLVASALTAFPPLCMGLFAPLGPVFARKYGEERALFLSVAILTAGILIRSLGIPGLLTGTVIASIGIAALNVLTPVFIRQYFAGPRIGAMMGVYAMMMAGGGAIMAALVVPLYHVSGGSWPIALASAAIPAAIALVALIPLLGSTHKPAAAGPAGAGWQWLLKHPTAWGLVTFFGIQSLVFYVVLSWMPAIYVEKGVAPATAGLYLAIGIFAVAGGGFFGPMLAGRKQDHRLHMLASIALCIIGLSGVMWTPPETGPVFMVLLGLGMGAGQGIPGILYAKRTANRQHMTQLSGMVQTFGYLIAATGPVITAALHRWSGTWATTLIFLLLLLLLNAVIGLRGGRDHLIGLESA